MKVIAVNGSPRKNRNTAKLLQSALDGAVSAGAETELIHLYDLQYTGCVSCFGCKRVGAETCRCYVKDDLSPLLQKVLEADVLLLGIPVYFNGINAQTHAFLERLNFILLTYDGYDRKLFEGKVDCGVFYTMNVPEEFYEEYVKAGLHDSISGLYRLNGTVEEYAACDTLQFDDYSKYHAAVFDESHKRHVHETVFPKDLAAAYDMGRRLAYEAK